MLQKLNSLSLSLKWHKHTHTQTQARRHTHTRACTPDTHTCTHTHTHTHARTHTRTCTHTDMQTHILLMEKKHLVSFPRQQGTQTESSLCEIHLLKNAKSAIFLFIRPIGPRDNGIPLNENASNLLTPGLGRHDRVERVDWQVGCRNKRSVQTDSKLESK